MTNIRDYIKHHILLFDGGMGTYFSTRNQSVGSGCELANLSQPELIADIHREYLEAGCWVCCLAADSTDDFRRPCSNRRVFVCCSSAWVVPWKKCCKFQAEICRAAAPL